MGRKSRLSVADTSSTSLSRKLLHDAILSDVSVMNWRSENESHATLVESFDKGLHAASAARGAEDFQPRYSIAAANRAKSVPSRLKLVRPARLTRLPPSGTRLVPGSNPVPTPGRLPAKELIYKD